MSFASRLVPQGRGLHSSAVTLFAAMTTQPTPTRAQLLNELLWTLNLSGIYSKLDLLHIFAAETSQAALLNIVNPGTYNATVSGVPSFTVDRGYAGDGVATFESTNFNPVTATNPKFTRDSCSGGVWNRTPGITTAVFGWNDGTDGFTILPSNGTSFTCRINTGSVFSAANTDPTGFFSLNRSASGGTSVAAYRNAVPFTLSGSNPSAALNSFPFTYGKTSSSAFTSAQISCGFIGQSLTADEHSILFSALNKYMGAIGAL